MSTLVCTYVHACLCGLACVYVQALEVSKGPDITQIKNVHPLIHGLTVCPSFLRAAARARVFVRVRGWCGGAVGGWGVGGVRWRRRRAKESFNNLATNICIPQSTGGLFFALRYLSKKNEQRGEKVGNVQKAAHFCVFVCRDLCVQLQTFIMSAFPLIDPLIKNMNNGGIKKMLLVVSHPH